MRTEYSNQFPVRKKPQKSSPVGVLMYYPYDGHPGQEIVVGPWWKLEAERKRLSQMGYVYDKFMKRSLR